MAQKEQQYTGIGAFHVFLGIRRISLCGIFYTFTKQIQSVKRNGGGF
ncbi:MAG: hypothetical protein K9J21_09675 [Bacteroidales bacterium]|nr:hypothetical protein [Bacteroidales bacterium]